MCLEWKRDDEMWPPKSRRRRLWSGYETFLLKAVIYRFWLSKSFPRLSNVNLIQTKYFFWLLMDTRLRILRISLQKEKSCFIPLTLQLPEFCLIFGNITYTDWIDQPHDYFYHKNIMFGKEPWPFTIKAGTLTTNLSHPMSKKIYIWENKHQ